MQDRCIKRVIELYFEDISVKEAITKVKQECRCGRCRLNCACKDKVAEY